MGCWPDCELDRGCDCEMHCKRDGKQDREMSAKHCI